MIRCILILILSFSTGFADTLDSLEHAASTAKDSARLKLLLEVSRKYRKKDLRKALTLAETALKESKEQQLPLFEGRSYYTIGGTYRLMGDYEKAFDALYTALHIMQTIGYTSGYSETANVIGLTHFGNSNYDSAVYYYRIYLDQAIKQNATDKLPIAYNNIANVFYTQKNYKKAIEYYEEAIAKCRELGKVEYLSTLLNNLGAIHDDLNDYKKAGLLFNEALVYAKKDHNLKQQASAHNNLGVLYRSTHQLDSALFHYERSLMLNQEIGDREGESLSYLNLGAVFTLKKQYPKAIGLLETSIRIAKEIGDQALLRDVEKSLAEAYMAAGFFEKAASHYRNTLTITDSLYNEENSRQINEMQAKYDTQKKENEILILNQDKKLQEEKSKKQNIILNAVAAGSVLIIILAFVLFRSNKLQKKANEQLTLQKEELEKAYGMLNVANMQILTKNQEITDSINYAKRIQLSLLPEPYKFKELFQESFIIYKPKDIVSGDFYWFGKMNGKKILAVADCTGHGVPGALMSMIGHEKLLEALTENNAQDPAAVLTRLDQKVTTALRQDDTFESAKDGMDIALVFINEANGVIEYAGANRPLIHFSMQTQDITVHKPVKSSIGGRNELKAPFSTLSINYRKGDAVYLFTDGYGDQIGGAQSKKLLSKNFLLKINSLVDKPFSEQGELLDRFFDEWKGSHEQVDDVLVGAFRL